MSLHVEHVNKWFGPFQAIKDLSMEVPESGLSETSIDQWRKA